MLLAAGAWTRANRAMLVASAAIVAFTQACRLLPYWLARDLYLGQVLDAYDLPPYVELLREASRGAWLWSGRTWAQPPGTGLLLYTPYIGFGHLVAPLLQDPLAQLELMRWVSVLALIACAWHFVATLIPPQWRLGAFLLGFSGGGAAFLLVGWVKTPVGTLLPIDLSLPAYTGASSLVIPPHAMLSVGLTLIVACGIYRAAGGRAEHWYYAAAAPALASFHPFTLPALYLAGGILWLYRPSRGLALHLLVTGTLCLPFAWYLFHLQAGNAVLATNAGNQLTTEHQDWLNLIAGRIWLLVAMAAGAYSAWRKGLAWAPWVVFLSAWVLLASVLAVAPPLANLPYHRTVEGVSFGFAALAVSGFASLPRVARVALLVLVAIDPCIQAPALAWAGTDDPTCQLDRRYVSFAAQVDGHNAPLAGSYHSMRWVVALGSFRQGSDDRERLEAELRRLTALPADQQPAALLATGNQYLIWGPEEKRFGPEPSGLRLVGSYGGIDLLSA